MDKRTILAFVLIGIIFLLWSILFMPKPEPQQTATTDTATKTVTPPVETAPTPPEPETAKLTGTPFAAHTEGQGRYVTVETPQYKAILNTRGGLLARFELKKYKTWYGAPVQLINDSTGFPGVLGLTFKTRDGREIPTDQLFFDIQAPKDTVIGEHDSLVVVARLALADTAASDSTGTAAVAGAIEKRYVFRGDSYGIGFDVTMRDMAEEIGGAAYQITWKDGLKFQEHNSVDEASRTKIYVSTSESIEHFSISDMNKREGKAFNGTINWVGMSTKYFGTALIPSEPIQGTVADVSGIEVPADSSGKVAVYDYALRVPYTKATETKNFTLFLGPLEYDVTQKFGVQTMVSFGATFIIRPIGEYFMLPLFRFLHSFIGNYGVVIIVFSLIIRLMLWPFSIPQIKSSRKMQLLQPKIAEARERFKDDQQRQQMETMNLYREYGINPLGGCLPLVLQLPILYALWGTLGSAIELRQAGFALWITDLSVPDIVVTLPFSLPLLGAQLSGLALIMGTTLFVQQKMLITDPKQKAMIYFMPIFLTLAFNHLPSGLNLYYLTFNILAIGQQVYMTKFAKNPLTLETLKAEASKKKKGWFSQKMEEAQKMAEMQGKTPGGQKKIDGRTPVEPRRKK